MSSTAPSNDMKAFRDLVKNAKQVAILTGAGISAESGIPTFRGAGGLWRTYKAQQLATPQAFMKNPALVWEFYHYRREVVLSKDPNKAHTAIADFEKRMKAEGKKVTVITQNVDELHRRAGTENLIELHGSLFNTICIECWHEETNYDSPICEGLRDRGAPEADAKESKINPKDLPRCKQRGCKGLLRPGVVWFGESLREEVLHNAGQELEKCDLCLVVGTSSIVYPAAMFAPAVAARGVPVAEFNLESTPETTNFGYHFEGPCGTTIPEALAEDDRVEEEERKTK